MTAPHCESGNALTENGEGLCLRQATKRVEFSHASKGTVVFDMCAGCAGHWSIMHPRTVKVLS